MAADQSAATPAAPGQQRLFVALELPPAVQSLIAKVQQDFAALRLLKARWVPVEKLHLTLKFLGETPTSLVPEIRSRLAQVHFVPFAAATGGVGVFPGGGEVRVFWVAATGAGISALQQQVDAALAGLFPPERRFMGHLTIARVQDVTNRRRLQTTLEQYALAPLEFTVSDFVLKESFLAPEGARYVELARFAGT